MEMFHLLPYALFFLVSLLTLKLFFGSRKYKNLPPGPSPLPIIGNLNLLELPLHRFLQRLTEKHGKVFSLWMGSRLAVVVSSHAAFQECFTKNDVALANRPRNLSGKHIFYNYTTVGSCSYGEHWRNLRRITSLEVLSTQRIHSFTGIRKDETYRMIRTLAKDSCMDYAPVELSSLFHDMSYNNMMRMLAGKRYYGNETEMKDVKEAKEFRETVEELLHLIGVSNKAEHLPFLRWFDFQNVVKRLKNISKRFDTLLDGFVLEQRSKKQRENTMIDHLLTLQESQPDYYTDQIIKGLVLAMLIGGTDSSAVTIEWAISNLLNHPEVLKKARDELDTHIGQDRLISESDLSKLPYLKKIILETLRLHPPAPISIPHVNSEDITIGEFNIPRDTMVLVNIWAIQRDPQLWNKALSFIPERFDVEGEEKKLVAFGMGRRACPGEPLAMQNVGLTLGTLIQCFEWKRVTEEEIDMTEANWFSLSRVTPLNALCKARPLVSKINLK
ncbi:isoflavone 2'-hydroxylase [Cajanus cajan]|uniref:Isoflavone 2'-hydroxylase n=1 Tax=Cajanus cajan TaxID=3821 RepID=A0A151R0N9_CAJCA|nr:isoflavone 2'-hydroxylase [Cajanus cajan]KYP36110.1 Isoflavone 2'-hydroxylase [Cajanus cajan]